MLEHQYNAEQALELLMRKLRVRDDILASQIQAAIDAGKDIRESEPSPDGRKRPRVYRKTVPFTHTEALEVALNALQAHFVEQPLFLESAANNLAKAAVGGPEFQLPRQRHNISEEREVISLHQVNEEKAVEIEVQTETQIEKSGPETQRLKKPDRAQIEDRERELNVLRRLMNFKSE